MRQPGLGWAGQIAKSGLDSNHPLTLGVGQPEAIGDAQRIFLDPARQCRHPPDERWSSGRDFLESDQARERGVIGDAGEDERQDA